MKRDHVNPGESYNPLVILPVKPTSVMKGIEVAQRDLFKALRQ